MFRTSLNANICISGANSTNPGQIISFKDGFVYGVLKMPKLVGKSYIDILLHSGTTVMARLQNCIMFTITAAFYWVSASRQVSTKHLLSNMIPIRIIIPISQAKKWRFVRLRRPGMAQPGSKSSGSDTPAHRPSHLTAPSQLSVLSPRSALGKEDPKLKQLNQPTHPALGSKWSPQLTGKWKLNLHSRFIV